MTDDANLAYNRNRYQSSILPSAESDLRYGSLSSKAVASGQFSSNTPSQPDHSPKANRFVTSPTESRYSSVAERATPMGLYGTDIPSIELTLQNVQEKVNALLSDHVAVVRLASHQIGRAHV